MAGRGMGCAVKGGGAAGGKGNRVISKTQRGTGPLMMNKGGAVSSAKSEKDKARPASPPPAAPAAPAKGPVAPRRSPQQIRDRKVYDEAQRAREQAEKDRQSREAYERIQGKSVSGMKKGGMVKKGGVRKMRYGGSCDK